MCTAPPTRRRPCSRGWWPICVDRAFGGSAHQLVQQALASRPASRDELAEIRSLLDDMDRFETAKRTIRQETPDEPSRPSSSFRPICSRSPLPAARALVHFLWQGALVALLAAGALALMRRSSAGSRYAVALGALV